MANVPVNENDLYRALTEAWKERNRLRAENAELQKRIRKLKASKDMDAGYIDFLEDKRNSE